MTRTVAFLAIAALLVFAGCADTLDPPSQPPMLILTDPGESASMMAGQIGLVRVRVVEDRAARGKDSSDDYLELQVSSDDGVVRRYPFRSAHGNFRLEAADQTTAAPPQLLLIRNDGRGVRPTAQHRDVLVLTADRLALLHSAPAPVLAAPDLDPGRVQSNERAVSLNR